MRDRTTRPTILPALALAALGFSVPTGPVCADWPGLRGPGYDGAVRDAALFDGDGGTLTVGWRRDLGSGYSVVAVDGSRLVTAFQAGSEDVVAAFDLEHGDELWRQPIGQAYAGHTGSHDGPIATPALHEGRVYALGPRGDLIALDAGTGETIWQTNFVEAHGAEAPYYGFAGSPLVTADVVVVGLGAGEGKTFGGFDVETGNLLWTAGTDTVRYQSPVLTRIGSEEQVLVVGNTTLSGLDPATGQLLWTYEHGGDQRDMGGNTIVPIPAGEGRVLLMNSHPSSVMLQITKASAWEVTELWSGGAIKSSYVQPVYHDGYLYGMNSKIFTCVDAATGETVWRSRDAGDGFPTLVGDHLVIMNKPGTLRVAEATPEGYREITSLELFDEHSWTAPAYANGHLYVRSMSELARIDIASAAESAADAGLSWVGATAFGQFLADLETADDKAAAIDAYLEAQASFPIVEDTGAVHFVYRGEAKDVGIVGDMIGFRREDPMIRVADTDLFYYSTVLEPDAAVGYGFIVDYEAPAADPLNPESHEGPFGEVSWFTMPAWKAPDFLGEADASRRGTTEEIEWDSAIKEGPRKATVYLPAGYDPAGDRRYPVLYFLDGGDALEQGSMKNALDNLIGRGVEPLLCVFVLRDPELGGRDLQDRFGEMVTSELVPLIDERFHTRPTAAGRAVAGIGWVGDTALLSAFNNPELFGRVGTLWPMLFGPAVPEAVPSAADHSMVIFHTWGTYHMRSPHEAWDQAVENRAFFEQLRDAGYRPAGGEVPEGVGWSMYRGYTDDMLTALFPMR